MTTNKTEPQPAPKTVRVRIAVSVNEGGEWSASGCAGSRDADVVGDLSHNYGDALYWIEGEFDVPDGKPYRGRLTVERAE